MIDVWSSRPFQSLCERQAPLLHRTVFERTSSPDAVMDEHLAGPEQFACDDYSIADMAILPWVACALDNPAMPKRNNLFDCVKRLKARPAVERGLTSMDKFIQPEVVEGRLMGLNEEHRPQLLSMNGTVNRERRLTI